MPTHEKQGFQDGGWDRWRKMKIEKTRQQWDIRVTVKRKFEKGQGEGDNVCYRNERKN